MSGLSAFRFVRTIGTVLTAEALASAAELRMPGQSSSDYRLPPGTPVNAAVARAWDSMLAAHREWHRALEKLPEGDLAIKVTREKWLLPLLYELGWGRLEALTAGLEVQPGLADTAPLHFPISHRSSYPDPASPTAWVPLHLVGAGVNLDSRTANVTARAPQSMAQDYLNRENRALWAILSNGRQLRLLRDASALTRQSYVEFDLDEIFTNQLYAEFRLLFLTVHASRFAPQFASTSTGFVAECDNNAGGEAVEEGRQARVDLCWLEQWRLRAVDIGSRARMNLQAGIALALRHLGNGFLACPENINLRESLANVRQADRELHRSLLRIAYRLIILFVAEDRGLLHTSEVPTHVREVYAGYFSTARLRSLAATHSGGRHTDLWEAHQIITDALAGDGLPSLGVPGLGANFFSRQFVTVLDGSRLPNWAFLAAIKALSYIDDPITGVPRRVDYVNLDSEEFGGMYEGLLAYAPAYDPVDHTFSLAVAPDSERKLSGSYYTPTELIETILTESVDPLISEALRASDSASKEKALLAITVCDAAAGSGHFVVAAARRIASAVAAVRVGDSEPSPTAIRMATADVIEHCVYGVDINDLALEITKAALWLEAFDASRPFPFLDAHFRCGNALIGATPALLNAGVPDAAFKAVADDSRAWATKLKARNKSERESDSDQLAMNFETAGLSVETGRFHEAAMKADAGVVPDLTSARRRAEAWRRLESDSGLVAAKLVADAWCAAFFQPKIGHDVSGSGITQATLIALKDNPQTVADEVIATIEGLASEHKFFHWHLEFPGIFAVGEGVEDQATGWSGGFSCVIGNPPWVFARSGKLDAREKEFFNNAYAVAEQQLNLFALFVERGVRALKSKGSFGLLLPNTWMTIASFEKLRRFVLSHGADIEIVNIYAKVFPAANVDCCILTLRNDRPSRVRFSEMRQDKVAAIGETGSASIAAGNGAIFNFSRFSAGDAQQVLVAIDESSNPLEKWAKVTTGIKAYQVGKGKPPQTRETTKSKPFHSPAMLDDSYVRYLDGVDVQRYRLGWANKAWISYGDHLAEPRRSVDFSAPRILVRQIPSKPPYCISAVYTDDYLINDINSMVVWNFEVDPYVILAVLNSRLISYWFVHVYDKFQRGLFPQFKVKELKAFPMPMNFEPYEDELKSKVSELLAGEESDFDACSRAIDEAVYAAFGLQEEHKNVIRSWEQPDEGSP